MSSNTKVDGGIEISFQDDRHYRHLVLPNKLTVLLIQDETADKASAALDVNVGHLLDPEYAPGLAHFCEHMLFMGTEKYPDENEYSSYLSSHGGSSNAYTAMEHTNYHFDVSHGYLEGALDRFAQFFISPLFAEDSTAREMQAVDSENAKNLQNDSWRLMQLYKSFVKKEHPGHKFGSGNLSTLKDMPKAAGKDIREELLAFHATHYSANLMGLAVVGREPLDQLQAWVEAKFSDIVNKDLPTPSFPRDPFAPSSLGVEVHVVPIKELRMVSLLWPVPPQDELYLTKPSRYVAHLIGHEGPGSILSLLKAHGWANELSAGLTQSNSPWAVFGVSIEVTEKGLAALHEVVGVVYQYIAMLQQEGPHRWVWEECKAEHDNSFRFKSKERPCSYASSVAPDLVKFPAQHVLSADRLLFQFDAAGITDLIGRLKPQGAILSVVSQAFAQEEGLQQENWYKTEHSVRPLSEELLQKWAAPAISPELRLPLANELIATDFSLRPHTGPGAAASKEQTDVGGSAYAPVVLKDTALSRLWFKQDLWYEKPKMYLLMGVNSPVAYESPEAAVYNDFFLKLVHEELNEYAYMAEVAGMSYSLRNNMQGFDLTFTGFSEKLSLFVQKVVAKLGSFQLEARHEAEFARLTDKIRRQYQNFVKEQPYQHAMYAQSCATELPRWTHFEKLEVLGDATIEGLRAFLPRLLGRVHLEALMHGNVNSQDALQLMESIERDLGARALLPEQRAVTRMVALTPGTTYVHAIPGHNGDDPNSALQVVFELGGEDVERGATLDLLAQIASEPVFNQLRTVEQLGYLVWSGASSSHGVDSFRVIVQSDKSDPAYLDARVENFLHMFRSQLVALSKEEFETHRAAAMAKKAEKDKSMWSEAKRHWREITDAAYHFDRATVETSALGQVTAEALLAFFDQYIAAGGERRAKFSSQVFSRAHGPPPAHPASASASAPPASKWYPAQAPDGEVGQSIVDSKESAGVVAALSLGDATSDEGNENAMGLLSAADVAAASSRVVYVDDVSAFKRHMPLHPVKPLGPPACLARHKL